MSIFSTSREKPKRIISPFYELGFHGDEYLLSLVDTIIAGVEVFIETGTNVGSTLAYVGRSYPQVRCLSCEPARDAFSKALDNTTDLLNVVIYNEKSEQFLKRLKQRCPNLFQLARIIFWLDAHGQGFNWPLKEEIAFITNNFTAAYILIDDFKVPGLNCFGYDQYQGQECSFEYIREDLNPERRYRLYYPNYTNRTSKHHPLRGWGLIDFGHLQEFTVPDFLSNKIQRIDIEKPTANPNEPN